MSSALAACALAGCVPAAERALDAPGVEAAIFVRVARDGAVLETRVVEPYHQDAPFVVTTASASRLFFVGYPRSLETYGLRVDGAARLELVARGGAPLPPPSAWIELDTEHDPRPLDVATAWPGPLAGVRVPWSPACPRVEMVSESYVLTERGDLSFVAALGRDHTLLVYDGSRAEGVDARALVATATRGAPVALPLPLGRERPRGFVEADGTPWLMIGDPDAGQAQHCRFDPMRPYALPVCMPAEGELTHIERLAGQRRPDGTLEMAAMTFDYVLLYWRGDADDRGRWRRMFRGGVYESPACVTGGARVMVGFEGPGRGVAAFESGTIEAWDADTGEHHGIFQDEAGVTVGCHWAYARHPSGLEVALRVLSLVGPVPSLPDPEVWWRADRTTPWRRHTARGLRLGALAPLDDVLVVTSGLLDLSPIVLDPARPDLPPSVCEGTAGFNSGELMVPVPRRQLMTGGHLAAAVARWRLNP